MDYVTALVAVGSALPTKYSSHYCSKLKSTELRGFSLTFPSASRVYGLPEGSRGKARR